MHVPFVHIAAPMHGWHMPPSRPHAGLVFPAWQKFAKQHPPHEAAVH